MCKASLHTVRCIYCLFDHDFLVLYATSRIVPGGRFFCGKFFDSEIDDGCFFFVYRARDNVF